MSLLSFNFVMIYTIHKMLVLLKNNLNYLFKILFENEYNKSLYFFNFFFPKINWLRVKLIESLEEENIIKDIGNLFRLKKN